MRNYLIGFNGFLIELNADDKNFNEKFLKHSQFVTWISFGAWIMDIHKLFLIKLSQFWENIKKSSKPSEFTNMHGLTAG